MATKIYCAAFAYEGENLYKVPRLAGGQTAPSRIKPPYLVFEGLCVSFVLFFPSEGLFSLDSKRGGWMAVDLIV